MIESTTLTADSVSRLAVTRISVLGPLSGNLRRIRQQAINKYAGTRVQYATCHCRAEGHSIAYNSRPCVYAGWEAARARFGDGRKERQHQKLCNPPGHFGSDTPGPACHVLACARQLKSPRACAVFRRGTSYWTNRGQLTAQPSRGPPSAFWGSSAACRLDGCTAVGTRYLVKNLFHSVEGEPDDTARTTPGLGS
jgi:hypothetical protein